MRPTASRLWLAFRCAYPFTSGLQWSADEPGPEARIGSAFHEVAAAILRFHVGPEVPESEVPWSFAEICARHNLDGEHAARLATMVDGFRRQHEVDCKLPWKVEQPYAYDPEWALARELPATVEHRDYSGAEGGEYTGTADAVLVNGKDGWVLDWKTGRTVVPAAESEQLAFLAVCVASAHNLESVTVMIAQVDGDGRVFVDKATLGPVELTDLREEITELDDRLKHQDPPTPGTHCRYCPVLAQCPASSKALSTVAPPINAELVFPVVADPALIQGPEHASWLLDLHDRAVQVLEQVEKGLRQYADQVGGIRHGDAMWQRKDVPQERIDLSPEGVQKLREMLPAALKETASKASITAAAKDAGVNAADILASLREINCIRDVMQVRYEDSATKPVKKRRTKTAA